MPRYVVDASAWIEYFISSSRGEKAKKIIDDNQNEIFTSPITIAEIMSVVKREKRDHKSVYETITSISQTFLVDDSFARDVGMLHADIRFKVKGFSLADAFVLLTARKLNARILTGDFDFKGFKEAVMI